MDDRLLSQRTFLLSRMQADKRRRLTSAALTKLPKAALAELQLDGIRTGAILADLGREGHVAEKTVRKNLSWHLTESGAAYLATLPPWPRPAVPEVVKPAHDDARLLGQQRAYALFQLLTAKSAKLSSAELQKKLAAVKAKPVCFDKPAIAWVLSLLVADGSVIEHRRGKSVSYQAAEDAAARLATMQQHPGVELTVNGAVWNSVKSASQSVAVAPMKPVPPPQASSPASPADGHPLPPVGLEKVVHPLTRAPHQPLSPLSPHPALPSASELEELVLAEFRDLLREKHWHTGMVPIHEIRGRIASRQGEGSARHDVLDERIKQLRRADRVRLISLSDLSRATLAQLADSIPGDNETFFYLGES